ncbi:MAG: LptF/LptG family permease [Dysgonamonadaceae bacterium]|jgi:lipopolysaccharide export system permease protein|nr:LptF/LptG family permease [Dysgonamonadaceae bacterium]MDD3355620.1 LptF/LptG family permease [Dysgonamonadaceae bacterium]MDD3726897.1 LptF/LptG family permease [Dysgonamonadaceae bacterium]MDD4247139.1 LptF/LptG family permease [Dysgonamonadaceae bacterium]MDD4606540.1 LptF/LptG family permease [Dysgonamonadaceae bacterium]
MKIFRLTILDRYIIKKFLGTFVFSIALIISISVVFDINEKIDKFITNNASLQEIVFDYYLNFIPYYANLFSPLFVFIAVIFFTSKLASNSEIIAILSNGVSFKRLLKPYMIAAAVIAIASFIFGSFIIPPSNVKRINFENKYVKKKIVDYASKIQMQAAPGVIAYFGSYDNATKTGYSFSLDEFDNNQLVSRLTANKILYDSAFHWTIKDYQIRNFEGLEEKITSGDNIDTILHITPRDFLISTSDYQLLTTPELLSYVKSQKQRGVGNIQSFEIEYHRRFASIMSAFILTLIGASLSARKVKGGTGLNIGIGLALSMGYILFMTISSSFAVSGLVSPMIAAWIPNLLFSIIAMFLYTKAPN